MNGIVNRIRWAMNKRLQAVVAAGNKFDQYMEDAEIRVRRSEVGAYLPVGVWRLQILDQGTIVAMVGHDENDGQPVLTMGSGEILRWHDLETFVVEARPLEMHGGMSQAMYWGDRFDFSHEEVTA